MKFLIPIYRDIPRFLAASQGKAEGQTETNVRTLYQGVFLRAGLNQGMPPSVPTRHRMCQSDANPRCCVHAK
jgi:hypothetical protein